MMKGGPMRLRRVTAAACLVAVIVACAPAGKHQGVYDSEETRDLPAMRIELREDGTGTWKKGKEKFSFNWGVKGEELRLHLTGGGVLVGHPREGGFEVALPGVGSTVFRKN